MTVTALYAGLLALWLVVLSFRVIFFRRQGDAADAQRMERAIRAQGNLSEYAPTFLILLLLAEQFATPVLWLHVLGGTFLVGRLMHGTVFAFLAPNVFLRVGGMILTLLALLAAAGTLLRAAIL